MGVVDAISTQDQAGDPAVGVAEREHGCSALVSPLLFP